MNNDFKLIESKIKESPDFKDLVKVSEVQDAFKKLSDGFQKKFVEIVDQFQILRDEQS